MDTRRWWLPVGTFLLLVAVLSEVLERLRIHWGVDGEVFAMAQYGPALAAILTFLIHRRRLRGAFPAPIPRAVLRAHIALAVAASLLFAVLLALGYLMLGGQLRGVRDVGGVPFVAILPIWLVGATAEEVGWRGLLQPLLERRISRWAAAALTGVIWSMWHLPTITQGGWIAVLFITATTMLAILMGFVADGSVLQRVGTAALMHWLVNLAILLVSGDGALLRELCAENVAIAVCLAIGLPMTRWLTSQRDRWGCSPDREAG